jgi:hypothetical protein
MASWNAIANDQPTPSHAPDSTEFRRARSASAASNSGWLEGRNPDEFAGICGQALSTSFRRSLADCVVNNPHSSQGTFADTRPHEPVASIHAQGVIPLPFVAAPTPNSLTTACKTITLEQKILPPSPEFSSDESMIDA